MIARPEFGQWCVIKAPAYKCIDPMRLDGKFGLPVKTSWRALNPFEKPVRAMFIGWRTVHEGITQKEVEYGEMGEVWAEYTIFERERSFEIWMFVEGPRRNVFRALPNDVCIEGEVSA